jgi:hypothetical protein
MNAVKYKCHVCGKVIEAHNDKEASWNMNIHLQTHIKEKEART